MVLGRCYRVWIVLQKKRTIIYLIGFTDSDYVGDQDDIKNTSRYVFKLGLGAIWNCGCDFICISNDMVEEHVWRT